MKEKLKGLALGVPVTALMAVSAFAAEGEGFNLASTVTSSVTSIAGDLMSVIGIVVAGIVGFFGAKIGINKAFSFIKTMIGKA